MANTGYINANGILLYITADPVAGTVVQGNATLSGDVTDISITASGGAVTVEEMAFPKKYPLGLSSSNKFKLCLRLSRPINCDETVTISSLPASLVSDGVTTNATGAVTVTNKSYYHDSIEELMDASTPIYFLDTANGNDVAAAAISSGTGYYTLSDYATPESESTGPQAYATLDKLMDEVRGTTSTTTWVQKHAVVLIRGGTTLNGETITGVGGQGLTSHTFGQDQDNPLIFGTYDRASGDVTVLGRSTTGGTWSQCVGFLRDASFVVISRGYILQQQAQSTSIAYSSHSSLPNRGSYLFLGVKIIGNVTRTALHPGFTQENECYAYCVMDGNDASGSGGVWSNGDEWSAWTWLEMCAYRCLTKNASSGGLYHGQYLKTQADVGVFECYWHDLGGNALKWDSLWGGECSDCIFTQCNSIGSIESNGFASAGFPADRTEPNDTAEYPSLENTGAYSRWVTWRRNIITDHLEFGSRGSTGAGLMNFIGPSIDSEAYNNLCVITNDQSSSTFSQPNDGGSGNGYISDTFNFEFRNNTMIFNPITSGTRKATGFSINPADSDTLDANDNDQVGIHGSSFYNNIIAFLKSTSGTAILSRFGTEIADQDYAASQTSGRSTDLSFTYNCFYDTSSYTNKFRNGGSSDLFSSISTWETDINLATGTPATGNRSENPGFADTNKTVSSYLINERSYASLDAGMTAIETAILNTSIPANLLPNAIAGYVLSGYTPDSLNESNYNNTTIGVFQFATAAASSSGGGITYGTSPGSWGIIGDFTNAPKFIEGVRRNSLILTKRGWEQRLAGTDPSKCLMEVVVAGNFGIPSGSNQSPVHYTGDNPIRLLTGVSSTAIVPYIIEINDPDKILGGDSVSVGATTGLPVGLSVVKLSLNSPMEVFAITGTPTEAATGNINITFSDTGGGSVMVSIPYTFS